MSTPSCNHYLAAEDPTPPRPLCALLSLSRSGVGLAPTLLLDRLKLHLLLPLFLPDLLQQLPPIISDSEYRAVNVIVIRKSLPFVPQILRLLRVSPARGERSVHPNKRAGPSSFRMVGA